MKILITETQYKLIIKENKIARFIDSFIEKNQNKSLPEVLEILLFDYRFSLDIINENENLKKFLEGLTIHKIDLSNPIGKLTFINNLWKTFSRNLSENLKKLLLDIIEGMLNELTDQVFKTNKDFNSAIKQLRVVKDMLPKHNYNIIDNFFNLIKERGKKEGYNIIEKPLNWTFEKGGGRVQQIIDYIREQPKLPKKTRRGWMEYIGEDPNRKGWNSYLWRAVQDAGIIEKVRDGNTFTYRLGPNVRDFEQGKLIGL